MFGTVLGLSASARPGKITVPVEVIIGFFIPAGVGGEQVWGEEVCVLSAIQLRVPFQVILVWVGVETTYTKLPSRHHIYQLRRRTASFFTIFLQGL